MSLPNEPYEYVFLRGPQKNRRLSFSFPENRKKVGILKKRHTNILAEIFPKPDIKDLHLTPIALQLATLLHSSPWNLSHIKAICHFARPSPPRA